MSLTAPIELPHPDNCMPQCCWVVIVVKVHAKDQEGMHVGHICPLGEKLFGEVSIGANAVLLCADMEGNDGRSTRRSAAAKKPRTKQLLCEQDPEAPGLTLEQRRKIRRQGPVALAMASPSHLSFSVSCWSKTAVTGLRWCSSSRWSRKLVVPKS